MKKQQKMILVALFSTALLACGNNGDNGGAGGNGGSAGSGGGGGDSTVDMAVSGGGTNDMTAEPTPDLGGNGGGSDGGGTGQVLVTTVDPGVMPVAAQINAGTTIGKGGGSTPATLYYTAQDTNNVETIVSNTNPFSSTAKVPDTAAGFCDYPAGGSPTRTSYASANKLVPMAPFYFPLVYTSTNTTTGNAVGGKPPMLGLFDWRPKDLDEAVVVAESDDYGATWYPMQTVLELHADYSDTTNVTCNVGTPASMTGCPTAIGGSNGKTTAVNGSTADDGWGHAALIQMPGANAQTGQMLYLLDRKPGVVDVAQLHVISLPKSSNKFPIWNTNSTDVGGQDIRTIACALTNTANSTTAVQVQDTVGLHSPDGIMAVFPSAADAPVGTPVTVLYVEKILNGDSSFPSNQKCTAAPHSGKKNDDVSNVRLATTTDGINFTDLGIVSGLNDPTTVDYNKTRWVAPRGTLLDINGDGSVWGLYFSAGNCLDGDSDAFHYIGYAESTDKMRWTVYNDINHPIASINKITTTNQADGMSVTVPAHDPVFPTQRWFAERLYAPTAVQIDSTHLSLTFAGYGVQSPNADLLLYRQIGNITLTVNKALPKTTPNNINAH